MEKRLIVKNKGSQTRHRLGVGFEPKKETEITVRGQRQYLQIKAVKDFEIIEAKDVSDQKNDKQQTTQETTQDKHENEHAKSDKTDAQEDTDSSNLTDEELQGLNIENFLKTVEEQNMDLDEAIALEQTGQNRVTLIEQLEELKEKEEEDKEGDN